MYEFFNQIWFGNPVKNYFIVAAVIIFVWALRRFISRYFAGLLFGVVHRIWKDVDKKSFTSLVVKPLGFFLLILVSIISLYKLKYPIELNEEVYKFTIKDALHCVGTMVLIVSFIGLLLRIIDFIALILEKRANLTADQSDNQLIVFFKDFFKVALVIIGILMVLNFAFDLNIGSLLTGLSIVGAAIALALRESLENLIASFIIFFDKPFTTGDLVKVHNVTGSVEKIGLRSTRIRTDQKTFVTVPNKQMVDSILDNLSLRTQRRGDLRLEMGVQTPPAKLEAVIEGVKKILERKEIEDCNVVLSEITSSAAILTSDYYTAPVTFKEYNSIKQDINLQALKLLEQLGVEIAGASTDVKLVKSE
ncbi:MAG TPA: mechanosensitive ion channel family protein [Chitinophagaceae bacterium]|jgi:MscS family membrane protein|nr:mechanosensitive ion channel family protein [Chitinophagaceae bacterium]